MAADGPGAVIDIDDLAKRITSDVIGQMILAEDLGAVERRWTG